MSLRPTSECLHVKGTASTATIALVSAVSGQRAGIYRMILTLGSPGVTVTIQDTSGAALSQPMQIGAGGAMVLDTPINGDPWWQSTPGLGLQLGQSGTTPIAFDAYYMVGP